VKIMKDFALIKKNNLNLAFLQVGRGRERGEN
jgi:hypothetical protein